MGVQEKLFVMRWVLGTPCLSHEMGMQRNSSVSWDGNLGGFVYGMGVQEMFSVLRSGNCMGFVIVVGWDFGRLCQYYGIGL